MPAKAVIASYASRVKEFFKEWSFTEFFFETFLSMAVTAPLSVIADLPWHVTAISAISIFGAIVTWMRLQAKGKAEAETRVALLKAEARKRAIKRKRNIAHNKEHLLSQLLKKCRSVPKDDEAALKQWLAAFSATVGDLYGFDIAERLITGDEEFVMAQAIAFLETKLETIHDECG